MRTSDGYTPSQICFCPKKAVYWDGCDDDGEPVANDIYFYTLYAGSYQAIRKMTITR